MSKRKTGVVEWAGHSANCLVGCSHNCRYCYAREMAVRFGRCSNDDWATPRLNGKALRKRWKKLPGVVMFPTTHDVLPDFLDECTRFLLNILEAGNRVLIVSKPHLDCIWNLCQQLRGHEDRIELRVTLGTLTPEVLSYWEPGAPMADERCESLFQAHTRFGWRTSLSAEPLLTDSLDEVRELVAGAECAGVETIWIGKLNQIRRRVRIETDRDREMVWRIEAAQTDEKVMELVRALDGNPRIRWKDSIKDVIDRATNKAEAKGEDNATS